VKETKRVSGGGASSRWKPTGVRGRIPRRCGDFTAFIQKYAFLGIIWSKFLLKTTFLNS